MSSELDLDVDTRRQVEPHQRVDGLGSRVDDVDETFVRPHLKVLPAVLVLVRGADDAEHVLLRGQWHRAGNLRARTRHCVDDLARRGVDDLVVIGLEPDADLLSRHRSSFFSSSSRGWKATRELPAWCPAVSCSTCKHAYLSVACSRMPVSTRELRPPWSGVSASIRRTTPVTCVLRRWPGPGPGVQATEQSRISRFGDLATRLDDQTC